VTFVTRNYLARAAALPTRRATDNGRNNGVRRWLRSSHWTRFARPRGGWPGCGVDGLHGFAGADAAVRLAELPFDLYIKAESEQPIGSFKLRGAYNRIAQLSKEELGAA